MRTLLLAICKEIAPVVVATRLSQCVGNRKNEYGLGLVFSFCFFVQNVGRFRSVRKKTETKPNRDRTERSSVRFSVGLLAKSVTLTTFRRGPVCICWYQDLVTTQCEPKRIMARSVFQFVVENVGRRGLGMDVDCGLGMSAHTTGFPYTYVGVTA